VIPRPSAYVNMKGIELMLKTLEARDPRAKTFDPANVVDSSFIQELEKSRLRQRRLEKIIRDNVRSIQ